MTQENRQPGYYFVTHCNRRKIGEWRQHDRFGWVWTISGIIVAENRITGISTISITPAAISALDEIVNFCQSDAPNELYAPKMINILTKHGLLPEPEKPKTAYYNGKKLSAVFNIPDETKYEIFVPQRIQVDKSEIEWR